jgi:hypothetical protein
MVVGEVRRMSGIGCMDCGRLIVAVDVERVTAGHIPEAMRAGTRWQERERESWPRVVGVGVYRAGRVKRSREG